jgi:hypothetical protein
MKYATGGTLKTRRAEHIRLLFLSGHPKPALNRHLKSGHFLRLPPRRRPRRGARCSPVPVGNVLDPIKQHQVLELGRLGGRSDAPSKRPASVPRRRARICATAQIAILGRRTPGGARPKPAIFGGVSTDHAGSWPPSGRTSLCQHLRPLSRADRQGARERAQCDGDLAGLGR